MTIRLEELGYVEAGLFARQNMLDARSWIPDARPLGESDDVSSPEDEEPKMGTITRTPSIEEDATFFRVAGEVEAEQVLSEIISFLTKHPTHLAIWDLAGGTLRRLSAKDLKTIVARAARYTGSRAGGRTAIVCVNDVDYGLSTMFEAFAKVYEVPIEIRVFRNRDSAQAWLDERPTSRDRDPDRT